jgi:hypothetical protein
MTPSPHAFAADWVAAWNAHDLERILSHYSDDIVFASPRALALTGDGVVRGKPALRAYWATALSLAPDLRFELETAFVGVERLTLVYQRMGGRRAAETFVFGADGRVVESMACYA